MKYLIAIATALIMSASAHAKCWDNGYSDECADGAGGTVQCDYWDGVNYTCI